MAFCSCGPMIKKLMALRSRLADHRHLPLFLPAVLAHPVAAPALHVAHDGCRLDHLVLAQHDAAVEMRRIDHCEGLDHSRAIFSSATNTATFGCSCHSMK